MSKYNKSSIADLVIIFFSTIILCLLLIYTEKSAQAVSRGIELSLKQLIPTLFPFMVLCSFLSISKAGASLPIKSKRLSHFEKKVIFLSFLGGYPVGIIMLKEGLALGQIDKERAARLCPIAFNPSPAFIVGTVGRGLFGSSKAAVYLLLCCLLPSVLMTFFYLLRAKTPSNPKPLPAVGNAEALIISVQKMSTAMLYICAWTLCFFSVNSLIEELFGNSAIKLLMEVSLASIYCAEKGSIPLCAFALSFGGLCVHCQLLPYMSRLGVSYKGFLSVRLAASLLSAAIGHLLVKISPVIAAKQTAAISSLSLNSAFASSIMLLMVTVLIFDIAQRLEMC